MAFSLSSSPIGVRLTANDLVTLQRHILGDLNITTPEFSDAKHVWALTLALRNLSIAINTVDENILMTTVTLSVAGGQTITKVDLGPAGSLTTLYVFAPLPADFFKEIALYVGSNRNPARKIGYETLLDYGKGLTTVNTPGYSFVGEDFYAVGMMLAGTTIGQQTLGVLSRTTPTSAMLTYNYIGTFFNATTGAAEAPAETSVTNLPIWMDHILPYFAVKTLCLPYEDNQNAMQAVDAEISTFMQALGVNVLSTYNELGKSSGPAK